MLGSPSGDMYCICNNPIIPVNMKTISLGKDTSTAQARCPYCHRIYRVDVTVLRETDLTPEKLKELIDVQHQR